MGGRFARALVAALALTSLCASCHSSKAPPPDFTGAWLDSAGELLLVIDASGDASFYFVAGMGACIDQLVTATVEGSALVTPSGKSVPISVSGNTLTITDPTGSIGGAYTRSSYAALCTEIVPQPGATSARVSTLTPTAAVRVGGGAFARTVSFTIPVGTVSFTLNVFGQDVGYDGLVIDTFGLASSSTNLLVSEPSLEECFNGQCNVFLPKSPAFPPTAGSYVARIAGRGAIDAISVRLVVRPGPFVTPTTLTLHPVVGPTTTTDAELAQVLDGLTTFYENRGIAITVDPLTKLADPRFTAPFADFLHPTTVDLMSNGDPNAVNLFFCDDLVGLEGLFGEASGIPGSLGIVGPWNGVLVNLSQHRASGVLLTSLLVETVAHESGHLLGLYHTTERNGRMFDILDDTPECTASIYDKDGDGVVLADECITADGHNVMFWTPSTSNGTVVTQDVLSADQVGVLSHSVIGE